MLVTTKDNYQMICAESQIFTCTVPFETNIDEIIIKIEYYLKK